MRCNTEKQTPKCFRGVRCPYPSSSTIEGAYGVISYSLKGPEGGEVIACLHGLNGSKMIFNALSDTLPKYGNFQVLAFDLYGHGMSNAPFVDLCPCKGCKGCSEVACCGGAPRGRYDMDFYVDQLDELLLLLGFGRQPVNVIGFSLGGAIAVAFAQRYPLRVLRLVPMSPAGFLPKAPAAYYLLKALWCCLIPAAPHVLCTCLYKRNRFARQLQSGGQKVDEEHIESMWNRVVWLLYVKRGVASATLATCHRIPWFNLRRIFIEAGKNPRPVLLVWGEKDSLNPTATVAKEVEKCFSNVQLMVVPSAGHIAVCDRPRYVVYSILAFLSKPAGYSMGSLEFPIPPPAQQTIYADDGNPPQPTEQDDPSSECEISARQSVLNDVRRATESAAQMPVPMVCGFEAEITL